MSNPTGDALMARIKELEEALENILEDYCSQISKYYDPEIDEVVIAARKALNK